MVGLLLLGFGCSPNGTERIGEGTTVRREGEKVIIPADSSVHKEAAPQIQESQPTPGYGFEKFKGHHLSDPIVADFNGDKIIDTAKFETRNHKAGVVITDGKTGKQTLVGCGNAFEEMGDDFGWVDHWGSVSDKSTYETIIANAEIVDGQKVVLDHVSIYVGKQEEGVGIISFKNGQYVWIHQSD